MRKAHPDWADWEIFLLTPDDALVVDQALDAPAKAMPKLARHMAQYAKTSFYDPITGENITFDVDGVTVTDFLTGTTTITPFVADHRVSV